MDNINDEYLDNWQIESFSKTMDFSLAAQKSIFTLNGAAAIAVLAFLGDCIWARMNVNGAQYRC